MLSEVIRSHLAEGDANAAAKVEGGLAWMGGETYPILTPGSKPHPS